MTDVFSVDVYGTFGPETLRVVWRDEPRPPMPALDTLVAQTWETKRKEAAIVGAMLFNGTLARLLRYRVEAGVLVIEAGPTDYANFLGTNFYHYDRGDEFGWNNYSNPVGTTATIITSDGWLLYGRRSHRVACHAGYVHTFGGGLEADERDAEGVFDVFASLMRELNEELVLEESDVTNMVCVGLIRDKTIRQPELIFDVNVRLTRDEIEQRLAHGGADQEHEAIVALRDEPDTVVPFIRAAQPIAPVAVGAVCLHGRRHFGEDWYTATCQVLRGDAEAHAD